MPRAGFKQDLFAQFARVGKAIGNANRLEILEFLAQGERSVESLANVSGLSVANTSQHLQQLRQAGLVTTRRDGQRIYYALAGDEVVTLLSALREVADRHVAEVERLIRIYLTAKDDLDPVPAEVLLEQARSGEVMVLDVRPPEEFAAGHVPGAVNIPLKELKQQLERMPRDKEIVAYCRGPYCVLAFEAVARLRKSGYRARRLEDGYPEWKLAGLPVESSPDTPG